jgi:hypothetical protein
MKLRVNPLFPNDTKQLSRELGILWRELATIVNGNIADTIADTGSSRNRNGSDTTDDIIIDNADAGLVLKSPDGDYWRIQVTNLGALTITNLGATKP